MKAKLVRIGNSKGIRLPKSLIELTHLADEVELEIRDGKIVISQAGQPRQAARDLAGRSEDEALESLTERAAELTGVNEKTALVRLGLEALIARESARRLAALGGSEKKLKPTPRRRPNAS